jgi:CRP-like cAMP-binding protein
MEFRNFLLAALAPDDAAALTPHMREVSLARSQVLYEPGASVGLIYFPSSACISVVEVMEDDRAVETATIGRESATALLDAMLTMRVSTRMFVQIAGSAVTLPAPVYRARLAESASLMQLSCLHLRAIVRQAEVATACNITHPADARLARWLLMTEDRTGSISFPLTQEYMAVMTGVQRTTVSGLAAAMKKAGLIDYQRGAVTVVDHDGLRARACACYGLMEDEFKGLRRRPGWAA